MISTCSKLSLNFRKTISGSQIDDECDALFFAATFRYCGVRVIFVFLLSHVLRELAFLPRVLILTASSFFVSFESLWIREHRTLWCCLFRSETSIFGKCCINGFQSDLNSMDETYNHFWAAPSSVVWVNAVPLCIQFCCRGLLISSGPIFKVKFAVTALK